MIGALVAGALAVQAAPFQPNGGWLPDPSADGCSVGHRFGSEGEVLLRITTLPFTGRMWVSFDLARGAPIADADPVTLHLDPDGAAIDRQAQVLRYDAGPRRNIGLSVQRGALAVGRGGLLRLTSGSACWWRSRSAIAPRCSRPC